MVKLPENDNRALHQEHRTEQETWEEICQHSNPYNTPMTLLELEEFAKIASHLIAPESEDNTRRRIQKAMNKLRELFNLVSTFVVTEEISVLERMVFFVIWG